MGLKLEFKDGQSPLDDDEKNGLLVKVITLQSELDELEELNIEKAIEWLMRSPPRKVDILTETFVRKLHKQMYGEVWKWAGQFRKTEKNIGIPWIGIETELRKLLDDANFWVEHRTYSPEETAIRFKHRLVFIHCFPNGNGRHSRIMADTIMERIFDRSIFTWGTSMLKRPGAARHAYISSLKEADRGNFKPLIEFAQS